MFICYSFQDLADLILPPRSGGLNLAVGFNPQNANHSNVVASATTEYWPTFHSIVADATPVVNASFRGLKPTAKFIASLCDEEIVTHQNQIIRYLYRVLSMAYSLKLLLLNQLAGSFQTLTSGGLPLYLRRSSLLR